MAGAVTLKTLELKAPFASIAQPGTQNGQPINTDITVTDTFTWTAGTLNSTSNLATVHLVGAEATIAPKDEGTVYLGSNLSVEDQTELSIEPGTIDAENDPVIETDGSGCEVQSNRFKTDSSVNLIGVRQINLGQTDHLFVWGFGTSDGATFNAAGTPLCNLGGQVQFVDRITATFGGSVSLGITNLPNIPYYQTGTSSATYIHNGSNVVVGIGKTMLISNGHLSTLFNSNLTDNLANQIAKITGDLTVNGRANAL